MAVSLSEVAWTAQSGGGVLPMTVPNDVVAPLILIALEVLALIVVIARAWRKAR
jgi:hypothetical protein